MKKFFKELVSNSDGTSSKRFSALLTLINLIALTWFATIKADDGQSPEFMFDALSLIVGGGLGLTVIEKIFDGRKAKYGALKSEETVDKPKEEETD